ncbi:GAF domain-containing protein [Streptomyces sp. NPDC007883]|uniref:GAF domain-containing protein n=1 Tax=Streptomyces sp. NPDC007883 TaxID=3155116 RepID=UPI0033D00F48
MLRRIIDTGRDLVRARCAALGVLEPGWSVRPGGHVGPGADFPASPDDADSPGAALLGGLVRDPRPLRAEGAPPPGRRHDAPGEWVRTPGLIGVPIRVRDQLCGHPHLAAKETGEPFGGDDEGLLTAPAGAAGVAIENARLHQQVRQATEEFQRRLLPETPDPPGLELQARHQPATEPRSVGPPTRLPGCGGVPAPDGPGGRRTHGGQAVSGCVRCVRAVRPVSGAVDGAGARPGGAGR